MPWEFVSDRVLETAEVLEEECRSFRDRGMTFLREMTCFFGKEFKFTVKVGQVERWNEGLDPKKDAASEIEPAIGLSFDFGTIHTFTEKEAQKMIEFLGRFIDEHPEWDDFNEEIVGLSDAIQRGLDTVKAMRAKH